MALIRFSSGLQYRYQLALTNYLHCLAINQLQQMRLALADSISLNFDSSLLDGRFLCFGMID